jgi:chromosome segregation ATPase
VNVDKAEQFLSGTYKKCEDLDLATDKIVYHIEDLTNLSDDIRLPEIERFIRQKTSEKKHLDKQIDENEEKIFNLKRQAEEIEKKRDHAFEMQRKAEEDIILHNQERESPKVTINGMKRKCRRLTRQNFALKQENSYAEKLPIYRALELHGVGNPELLTILKAVLNISVSNGIPFGPPVEKFINDIKTQYDSKLGFESKIEDLKC